MSFTDFVRVQNDLAHALLSDEWLAPVNIVTRHQLLQPSELARLPDETYAAEVLAYITPRNQADGRTGCGVIVEVPEITVLKPNLAGPEMNLAITCLVIEEPLTNAGLTEGTLKPADQVAQRILEIGHGLRLLGPTGFALMADLNDIRRAQDFEPLRAHRVVFATRLSRAQTNRVAQPAISVNTGTATLTCATSEANIYYTITPAGAPESIATFPGPSNPAAQLYAAPFAVNSGELLRCAGFKTSYLGSDVNAQTIT